MFSWTVEVQGILYYFARRCGLLKLFMLSLTSKEFSGGIATKFILSLAYRSEVSYKQRLLKIGLLLLLLARIFRFGVSIQFLVSLSDRFISVMNSTRPRHTVSSKGTLLNTIRANTVTFENSFYCRAPGIWNTLPTHLRNTDCSVVITCISLSLFMMSTPPRPLRVCVLSATLVGH